MSDKTNTPRWPEDDLPGRLPDPETLGRIVRARAAELPQPEAGEAPWDWAARYLAQQQQRGAEILSFRDFVARRRRLRPDITLTVFAELQRLKADAPSNRPELPQPTALHSDRAAIDVSFREEDGGIAVHLQVRSGAEGIERVRGQDFALVFGEVKSGLTTDPALRFDDNGHAAIRLADTLEIREVLAAGPYTLIALG